MGRPVRLTDEERKRSNAERQRRYKKRHGWVARVRQRESMRALRARRKGGIRACEECGYKEQPEILELHHIDGDHENDAKDNLMVLCPNCHRGKHSVNNEKPRRDDVQPSLGELRYVSLEEVEADARVMAEQKQRAEGFRRGMEPKAYGGPRAVEKIRETVLPETENERGTYAQLERFKARRAQMEKGVQVELIL